VLLSVQPRQAAYNADRDRLADRTTEAMESPFHLRQLLPSTGQVLNDFRRGSRIDVSVLIRIAHRVHGPSAQVVVLFSPDSLLHRFTAHFRSARSLKLLPPSGQGERHRTRPFVEVHLEEAIPL